MKGKSKIKNQKSKIKSEERLVQAALEARTNAVAPYSNFLVGAAVETDAGEIFTGCNVENSTYGLTVCAERIAIFKALSEGRRKFTRIAVAADTETPTPPCGACRQIIWEFCGDIPVVMTNLRGRRRLFHMRDLFPNAFDGSFLK